MTTIVANGLYLVADHRSKYVIETPLKTTGERGLVGSSFDYTDKIFLPTNLVVGKIRIRAFSLAGDVSDFTWLLEVLEGSSVDVDLVFLCCIIDALKPTSLKNQSGRLQLIGITDEFETALFNIAVRGEETSCTYEFFPTGTIVTGGSGGSKFSAIEPYVRDFNALDVESIFLFCAGLDKHSSYSYACYSAKKHHKFTDVSPTHERILQGRNSVMAEIVGGIPLIWANEVTLS